MDLDKKDISILAAIAETGTGSPDAIQEETSIPKSTVHYRIKKLRESGIIKNNIFDIDIEKLGLELTLITEIFAEYEPKYHHQVGEQLADIEGVNQVYFTMGDTDFIVISHLASREMVEELIEGFESIEAIQRTSSKFVITTIKDEPHPFNDFELETLQQKLIKNSEE